MKVRCTALISPINGESLVSSPWVHVGGEYLVVGVAAVPEGRVTLQIIEDSQQPSWWDSAMFDTTDPHVPSNWVAEVNEEGVVTLGPARWMVPSFWENYFNREPTAIEIYAEELRCMLGDD